MFSWLWGGIKRVVGGAAGAAWRWVSDRFTGTSIELAASTRSWQLSDAPSTNGESELLNNAIRTTASTNPYLASAGVNPDFDGSRCRHRSIRNRAQSFDKRSIISSDGKATSGLPQGSGQPGPDDIVADRPKPQPCDAVGVALSGGGIRSAAFSIGALQALDFHHVLDSADYLSTVSGGGYAGISLSAGMSVTAGQFPFSDGGDVHDNDAIGHIRNYSNYLMPRIHSGLRNALDVAAILLRGLCANAVVVLTFLLISALFTWWVYPNSDELLIGSFLPRFFEKAILPLLVWIEHTGVVAWLGQLASASGLTGLLEWLTVKLELRLWFGYLIDLFALPFGFTLFLIGLLAFVLLFWALRRSIATFPILQRGIAAVIELGAVGGHRLGSTSVAMGVSQIYRRPRKRCRQPFAWPRPLYSWRDGSIGDPRCTTKAGLSSRPILQYQIDYFVWSGQRFVDHPGLLCSSARRFPRQDKIICAPQSSPAARAHANRIGGGRIDSADRSASLLSASHGVVAYSTVAQHSDAFPDTNDRVRRIRGAFDLLLGLGVPRSDRFVF